MRTAHLIVSGTTFAVWFSTCVLWFGLGDPSISRNWYLYGPAAVLPPFWCCYAWIASRRSEPSTVRRLTILAVPVLLAGLVALQIAISVAADVWRGVTPRIGYAFAVTGGCCWEFVLPFGLISFVWAIVLQIKSARQPRDES